MTFGFLLFLWRENDKMKERMKIKSLKEIRVAANERLHDNLTSFTGKLNGYVDVSKHFSKKYSKNIQ